MHVKKDKNTYKICFITILEAKLNLIKKLRKKTSQTHFAAIDWNTVSESTVAAWSLTLI